MYFSIRINKLYLYKKRAFQATLYILSRYFVPVDKIFTKQTKCKFNMTQDSDAKTQEIIKEFGFKYKIGCYRDKKPEGNIT